MSWLNWRLQSAGLAAVAAPGVPGHFDPFRLAPPLTFTVAAGGSGTVLAPMSGAFSPSSGSAIAGACSEDVPQTTVDDGPRLISPTVPQSPATLTTVRLPSKLSAPGGSAQSDRTSTSPSTMSCPLPCA